MILYVRTGCPFCVRIQLLVAELGIQNNVDERNIEDQEILEELMEKGGKQQVPYLVDSENDVELYESEEIKNYLIGKYGNK